MSDICFVISCGRVDYMVIAIQGVAIAVLPLAPEPLSVVVDLESVDTGQACAFWKAWYGAAIGDMPLHISQWSVGPCKR